MSTRRPSVEGIASGLDETMVTVTNFVRAMTTARAPYNTAIGRGNHEVHLDERWLASTFLAIVVSDLKHAVDKVPVYGDLVLYQSRLIQQVTTIEGNKLNFKAPKLQETYSKEAVQSCLPGKTVFEVLTSSIGILATDWGGGFHKTLKEGFKLTINLGVTPSAEASLLLERKGDVEWWVHSLFIPEQAQIEMPRSSLLRPIPRQAVILCEHIEMLAALYADTLKHMEADEKSAPSVEENSSSPKARKVRTRKAAAISPLQGTNAAASNDQAAETGLDGASQNHPRVERKKTQSPTSQAGHPHQNHWSDRYDEPRDAGAYCVAS